MIHTASAPIQVLQGEFSVSSEPDTVLSAILGSCVATCLWDPVARVGGMNHILLPGSRTASPNENKYGVFAMEALINALMKKGARKTDLVAKIFGGAQTYENSLQIGEANATFVRQFLEAEDIQIKAASLGGTQARRVRFYPESGRARQMITGESAPAPLPEQSTRAAGRRSALPEAKSGDLELF